MRDETEIRIRIREILRCLGLHEAYERERDLERLLESWSADDDGADTRYQKTG